MAAPKLYPLNDFAMKVKLWDIDTTTLVKTPVTTGAVSAFLATSDSPTALPADPTLAMNPPHINGADWAIFFDATTLLPELLETLFALTPPYLIVVSPSGVRAALQLEYVASRPGTLVE